jgi:hypothetical protein
VGQVWRPRLDNQNVPRTPREHIPGALLHVISRFVNREIRVTQPEERERYLRQASRAITRTDLRALGYALMGNHVHWGSQLGYAPLRDFFQPLHSSFARWLNGKQGRLGPLFACRPKQFILDEERFAYLIAYIHNNPVRAGVVGDPADSDWTSHRAYIGEVEPPPWLDVGAGLALCGFDSSPRGRGEFHDFVRAAASDRRDTTWGEDSVARVRTEVRSVLRAPVEIGVRSGRSPRYAVLARPNTAMRGGGSLCSVRQVIKAAAREFFLAEDDMRSTSRRRDIVAARRLALLVWSRELGRPQAEMAAALGLSDSAASQLLGRTSAVAELAARAGDVARRRLSTPG